MKALYTICLIALAVTGCTVLPPNANTFLHSGVVSGSVMTQDACKWPDTSVWVVVDGQGECVRYFHGGLEAENNIAHVHFHGDRLWHSKGKIKTVGYRDNGPAALQSHARGNAAYYGLPYIRLSRPGVYGSSGDHKQRRLARESLIVNAALDAIKRRYRIKQFHLSGQSGGGHVVAALLPRRNDVRCAVITSGVVAVAKRNFERGWSTDITGYDGFYDPIDHVREIAPDPTRRIFVVGDPGDTNVPFSSQSAYYTTLKSAGHNAWLVEASGKGSSNHSLSHVGFPLIKACHSGASPKDIAEQASAL